MPAVASASANPDDAAMSSGRRHGLTGTPTHPSTHALALYSLTVGSRDGVDAVSATALVEGATEADGAEDFGFMDTRSFFDLDGHGWQIMWIDPAQTGTDEPAEAVA